MAVYQTEALALRLAPFEETGGLVTLLTREQGKVKAVAKGIRRPQSSLAAAVQPGSHSFVSIAAGRTLDILTQARLVESFAGIRGDLIRLAHAIQVLELLDLTTAVGQAEPELFGVAVRVLGALEEGYDPGAVLAVLEVNVLHLHGVGIALSHCGECGEALESGNLHFSISSGGVVCGRCARRTADGFRLTARLLEELRGLESCRAAAREEWPRRVSPEARRVLQRFLTYHLGVEPRSTRFLQTVTASRSGGRGRG